MQYLRNSYYLQCLQEAGKIRGEADITKTRATDLRDEADELERLVDDAESRLQAAEDQAKTDDALSREVSKLNG